MVKYEAEKFSFEEAEFPDYSKYFLNNNPFFGIPVATRERTGILVDRKGEVGLIQTAIMQALKADKKISVLLEGEYGSGKSHLLFISLDEVRRTLMTREGVRALGAYVTPGSRFIDFYSNLIEDIGLQVIQGIVRKVENELGTSDREKFVKRIEKEGIEPDFAAAISYLTYKYEYATTWRWLQGQKLTASERIKIGVSENLDTEEAALGGYENLRRLMRKAGYQVLCIFFDELEKICEATATASTRYFDNLRHLIDRDPGGLCLITTVTPAGANIVKDYGYALYRRLIMHGLSELKLFDDGEAIQLIGLYLKQDREEYLEASKRHGELKKIVENIGEGKIDEWSFPFSYDGVKAINLKAGGKISEILRYASILIEQGNKEGQLYVSDEYINKVLGTG